jgi:hypothetical protein
MEEHNPDCYLDAHLYMSTSTYVDITYRVHGPG